MKRNALLTRLCIALFFLLFSCSLLCTKGLLGKAKPDSIEGEWIEVSVEKAGFQLILPDYADNRVGSMEMHRPYAWRISKEKIEEGPDEKDRFPRWRYTYKLNSDNQEGAIDLILLDEVKDKKRKEKPKKQLAIFFVKDDYLMICFGRGSRPKRFSTSKDNPNLVYILRRSKLKSVGPGAAEPKRRDK